MLITAICTNLLRNALIRFSCETGHLRLPYSTFHSHVDNSVTVAIPEDITLQVALGQGMKPVGFEFEHNPKTYATKLKRIC